MYAITPPFDFVYDSKTIFVTGGFNLSNKFSEYNSKYNHQNDDLEKLISKYGTKSQSELMNEFIKLSSEKIKNGTLNKNSIDNIKKTIFPYLTEEQKKSFYSIISQVTNE